jgi:hypothetical protein
VKKATKKPARKAVSKNVCGMPHSCGNTCGLRNGHGGSHWCVPCQKDF